MQPALPQLRGHQRLCHGRRSGSLPGLRFPGDEHRGQDRPAGNQAGHLAGWGGTVRLPRIIGVDEASCGWPPAPTSAPTTPSKLAPWMPCRTRATARRDPGHPAGRIEASWTMPSAARQSSPLPLNDTEAMMAFFTIKSMVAQQAGKNYPAPVKVVEVIEAARSMSLEDALDVEADGFAELATTPVPQPWWAFSCNDQLLGKKAKGWEKKPTRKSRRRRTGRRHHGWRHCLPDRLQGHPIKMKDIAQEGLDLGLSKPTSCWPSALPGRMTPTRWAKSQQYRSHPELRRL